MDNLHTHIQHLEQKIIQLKEKYLAQKKIIHTLQQDNDQLRLAVATQKYEVPANISETEVQLPLKNLSIKIAGKEATRKLLEQYIQQIDQCIDFLEKFNGWKNLL